MTKDISQNFMEFSRHQHPQGSSRLNKSRELAMSKPSIHLPSVSKAGSTKAYIDHVDMCCPKKKTLAALSNSGTAWRSISWEVDPCGQACVEHHIPSVSKKEQEVSLWVWWSLESIIKIHQTYCNIYLILLWLKKWNESDESCAVTLHRV